MRLFGDRMQNVKGLHKKIPATKPGLVGKYFI